MFSETDLVNDDGQSIPFTALILSRVFDRPFELPGSASVVFPQLRGGGKHLDDGGGGVAHNSGASAAAGKDVGSGGGAFGGEAGASNERTCGDGGGGDGKGSGVSGGKAGQVSLGFWLELLTRQIGDATGVVALEVMSALVEASLGVQGVYAVKGVVTVTCEMVCFINRVFLHPLHSLNENLPLTSYICC
jgi:hypothetical protein